MGMDNTDNSQDMAGNMGMDNMALDTPDMDNGGGDGDDEKDRLAQVCISSRFELYARPKSFQKVQSRDK
jgi:hypothetical protein